MVSPAKFSTQHLLVNWVLLVAHDPALPIFVVSHPVFSVRLLIVNGFILVALRNLSDKAVLAELAPSVGLCLASQS